MVAPAYPGRAPRRKARRLAVERSCCGCRTRRDKQNLVRFVRVSPEKVQLDPEGRAQGRGGYVCRTVACMELALKRGGLARTLRMVIPAEQAPAIRQQFVGYLGVGNGEH